MDSYEYWELLHARPLSPRPSYRLIGEGQLLLEDMSLRVLGISSGRIFSLGSFLFGFRLERGLIKGAKIRFAASPSLQYQTSLQKRTNCSIPVHVYLNAMLKSKHANYTPIYIRARHIVAQVPSVNGEQRMRRGPCAFLFPNQWQQRLIKDLFHCSAGEGAQAVHAHPKKGATLVSEYHRTNLGAGPIGERDPMQLMCKAPFRIPEDMG
ncbi:hypothetical protein VNO77_04363 [Canavalia gladiata]|uniref:Uncharacterized protein n=1 Tax=Canavalia gladiata TaxID=3824 RepID=A0AAN9RD40_CANGL